MSRSVRSRLTELERQIEKLAATLGRPLVVRATTAKTVEDVDGMVSDRMRSAEERGELVSRVVVIRRERPDEREARHRWTREEFEARRRERETRGALPPGGN